MKCMQDLWQSMKVFGWKEVNVEVLSGLKMTNVKQILKAIARRKVRGVWREEAKGWSKLVMIGRLMDYESKACCVESDCKRQRSMLATFREVTANLELKLEDGVD